MTFTVCYFYANPVSLLFIVYNIYSKKPGFPQIVKNGVYKSFFYLLPAILLFFIYILKFSYLIAKC